MRMPLREYSSPEEIRQFVRDLTKDGKDDELPENQAFLNVSRFVLEGRWEASKIRFFSYPVDRPIYSFLTDQSDFMMPFVYVRAPPRDDQDISILHEAIEKIYGIIEPTSRRFGKFIVQSERWIGDEFISVLAESRHHDCAVLYTDDYYAFYMNEEQREKLLQKKLVAPEGYKFAGVKIESELDMIHGAWEYNENTPSVATRARLEQLPYASLRTKDDEMLVAWELSHRFGMLTQLYTIEEHRGKGLGVVVEQKLAQDYVAQGLHVYKFVSQGNTALVDGTMKHPLWTCWTRPKEIDPVRWSFTILSHRAKPTDY